jgi:ATP-binding cassette subfamily B protein
VRELTAASLRAAIAVVPQDSYLFNDAILENVRYGRPTATDAEVRAACRQAQADAFIPALPQGYRTVVGERGLQLSVGQRQRLAIARALLKDAPILLLDEATSALDAATEHQLREAMAAALRGRTTLIIAHRLATVMHLDRLLVLHRGRLIDEGSHDELLARSPVYARLVATQIIATPCPEPVASAEHGD